MDSSKCSTLTHLFTLFRLHYVPRLPFSLLVGDIASVKWYTSMTGNQMMDYYVQPWNIYSHTRTCTHSGLCRRPSILVAFHVCYLLDHANVHQISALVIWFQCISDIFINYGDLDPLYIFIHYGDIYLLYIFVYHTWHFVYHAYSWPLYSYVSGTTICICSHMQRLIIVLYWWMAGSYTYFFITPLLGLIL